MQAITSVLALTDEDRQRIGEGAEVEVTMRWEGSTAYLEVKISE
jgi:hypothetical protein